MSEKEAQLKERQKAERGKKKDQKKENKNLKDRNEELTRERDKVQDELDTYHVPVHRIIWRRFKELIGNNPSKK